MYNTEIENFERYKIELDTYSLLYYPSTKTMSVEYWDDIEEDDVEVIIYDETGYHLENSFIKDLSVLDNYLKIFKEIN